jgi:hypothetical protein
LQNYVRKEVAVSNKDLSNGSPRKIDKKEVIESNSDVKNTSPRILELMNKISYLENA